MPLFARKLVEVNYSCSFQGCCSKISVVKTPSGWRTKQEGNLPDTFQLQISPVFDSVWSLGFALRHDASSWLDPLGAGRQSLYSWSEPCQEEGEGRQLEADWTSCPLSNWWLEPHRSQRRWLSKVQSSCRIYKGSKEPGIVGYKIKPLLTE